ncbi:MAG TPA: hypothetical protein VM674_00435, partial [Candidatus Acidoferrum sp.]|nr:hypothetical protein [Candidatus Acidoferrum sp.]
MRLEHLHRRHSSALSAPTLLRYAWKLGVGLLMVGVIAISRGAAPPLFHANPRALATSSSGPTLIQCGTLPV